MRNPVSTQRWDVGSKNQSQSKSEATEFMEPGDSSVALKSGVAGLIEFWKEFTIDARSGPYIHQQDLSRIDVVAPISYAGIVEEYLLTTSLTEKTNSTCPCGPCHISEILALAEPTSFF